jgi:hypothetical protein
MDLPATTNTDAPVTLGLHTSTRTLTSASPSTSSGQVRPCSESVPATQRSATRSSSSGSRVSACWRLSQGGGQRQLRRGARSAIVRKGLGGRGGQPTRPPAQARVRQARHAAEAAASRAVRANAADGEPKGPPAGRPRWCTSCTWRAAQRSKRAASPPPTGCAHRSSPRRRISRRSSEALHDRVGIHRRALAPCYPRRPAGGDELAIRSVARRHPGFSEEIAEPEEPLARPVAEEAAPAIASPLRGASIDNTAVALCWAQPGTTPGGSKAKRCRSTPVWRDARAGLFGQDRTPPPRPRGQRGFQRVTARVIGAGAGESGRTHPRVRREARGGAQEQEARILRCLERNVAREAYRILMAPGMTPLPPTA